MAEIVLGLGMSHTPQMSMSSDHWENYAKRDASAFPLIWRRKKWDYEDLVRARKDENLGQQISGDVWREKFDRISLAVEEAAGALLSAAPDVVVVIGDDHHEIFGEDSMPTFAIFWGENIEAVPPKEIFDAVRPAAWALFGEERETYPCDPKLGRFLIEELHLSGFDVAQVNSVPDGVSAGHPFISVRQRLMRDYAVPIPIVPVVLNTYFPPNVPTPGRSWDLGRALGAAISEYPEDLRVAVVASGGLSHFVVDLELDKQILAAIESDSVHQLDRQDFVSGTSECLCWFVAGGACTELRMELLDVVPGYRTLAGTGCTMAAAVWR